MIKKFTALIASSFLSLSIQAASDINLNSKSYILVDYTTMQVLSSMDENKRMSPASLTKVLTAYIVYDYIKKNKLRLDDEVLISKNAWKTGGSRMFVEVGKKVKVEELLKGLIIQSGNDSAVALAEHISGTEESFADLMNYYASQIGMINSHFENSTGLPKGEHYSTAKDLSILAYRTIKDHPELLKYYSIKDFEFNNIFQNSSNEMLKNEYFDGMKTGFTNDSGYSYIGTAAKDGKRMISVQLKADTSKDRFNDAEILFSHFFNDFNKYKIANKYKIIKEATVRVRGGEVNFVRGAPENDVVFLLPNDTTPKIDIELHTESSVKAPVKAGQVLGNITVYIDGLEAKKENIVAVEDVNYGSKHRVFFEMVNGFLRGEKND